MRKKSIDSPVRIRPADAADVAFIFSSWLRSYRHSRFAQDLHTTIYFTEHHKVIESILQTCDVLVACDDKNPADIFGYICFERVEGQFVLHYIYTKQTYRMLGIATLLLEASNYDPSTIAIYSHHNVVAPKLATRYNFIYSPYIGLTASYRKPLEGKITTPHISKTDLMEKPEEMANNSPFKKES